MYVLRVLRKTDRYEVVVKNFEIQTSWYQILFVVIASHNS